MRLSRRTVRKGFAFPERINDIAEALPRAEAQPLSITACTESHRLSALCGGQAAIRKLSEPVQTNNSLQSDNDGSFSSLGDPAPEESAALNWFERFAFHLVRRMNQGNWKRFWTWCQKVFGAGWIHLSTYNLLKVYGIENVHAASRDRPILLVANHRSFFDMYTVSTVLFRHTTWRKQLFFPVRGRFFYQTPLGMFVNLVMGWWSMYPPFFASGENPLTEKRAFDKYSFRLLTSLAREGAGNVIGFHPEGTRNKNSDPYSYLPAQPGVGKLIKDAAPQVIPIFIAGLGNDLPKQVMGNWTGGDKIRIYFGPQLDLSPYLGKRDHMRTYKEISEFVMSKIAELGEKDRKLFLESSKTLNAKNAK